MKILVISQYYHPEPFRITDICEELVKRGHEVDVVAGIPNYPMGYIYEGYRGRKKCKEVLNGVNIQRCFTIGRRTGIIWRFLNYYSFFFSSVFYASCLKKQYDVVFVNQLSPVMMAQAGIKYSKKTNTKILIYCLDLWPESLVAGNIKKTSVIYKFFHRISERIYKAADKILVTSSSFIDYFKNEFCIPISDLGYLPQYSEDIFSYKSCVKKKNEFFDLMFAGNVGAAQNVDVIVKAAALTKDDQLIRWHIVGDGSELENCKKLADSLGADNIVFHGRKTPEEMPQYYSMADVMLITMIDDPVISYTLPGKIQTYMSAGKPILSAATGEIERVIKDASCGICCPVNDSIALAEAAKKMSKSDDKLFEYGKNACRYNAENFSKEAFFDILINELEILRKQK